ncbi:MAG TPA: hypothetical protein VIO60_01240 [Rectinemataceae bacterium]
MNRLETFASTLVVKWKELYPGARLRVVFHELDTNTDASFASVAKREAERILLARPEVILLERDNLGKVLDEASFEASNFFSMEDIKPLRLEGADAVVYGLLADEGSGKVRFTLSCLEYATGKTLARESLVLSSDFPGLSEYRLRAAASLPAPTAPQAEEGPLSVKLAWEPIQAFDVSYEILRSEKYDVEPLFTVVGRLSLAPKRSVSTAPLEFVDRSVQEDVQYFYRIRYLSRGKVSELSGSVQARPFALPVVPAQLSGSWNADMNAAVVTWKAAAGAIVTYEYEAVSGEMEYVGATDAPVAILREYQMDEPLQVRVRALSPRGVRGEFSPWATIPVPPASISGLTLAQAGDAASLSWQYPTTRESPAFRIYEASGSDGDFTLVGETAVREFTYSGFATGTTLRFRVRAVNRAGIEGPMSAIGVLQTHTPPPIPERLSAKVLSRFILVEWSGRPFPDLIGYSLSVLGPDGAPSIVYEGLRCSYTFLAPTPGRYTFSLVCANSIGQTSPLKTVEATVLPF